MTADAPESPSLPDELRDLIRRAERGDESTLPALRKALDEGLISLAGGIADAARRAVLAPAVGRNLLAREHMSHQIDATAAELAGPDPTPIERLLAERAAFCWHVVHQYEFSYARDRALSLQEADYHQRRIDAAHRRYMSALKTLATVRKLAVPAIQVNIAEKQVNLASVG